MRSRPPTALVVAATIATLLGPGRGAFADAVGDLEKAYGAYAARKYQDAERRLRTLLEAKTSELNDPDKVADARMYLGAVLVAEGKKDDAGDVFEKLLEDSPSYEPDKLRVQLDAIDAFIDVHTRLRAKLERIQSEQAQRKQAEKAKAELERQKATLRLATLEKLATEVRVVERNSRWTALLPFGVGQFQNGQDGLGWVFLSSEALLAAVSVGGAVVSLYESGQANDSFQLGDPKAATGYHANALREAIVADACAGGFYLTAIVGAVLAEVTFVPERGMIVRKREPSSFSLAPIVAPTAIGVGGRF